MDKPFPSFGPPPVPVSPDAALVRKNAETFERELIFALWRHYAFYREMRDKICIYDPLTTLYKQDFSVRKYNTLYQAIDAYWRRFDNSPGMDTVNVGIPPILLKAFLIDWSNANQIPPDICTSLCQEIDDEAVLAAALTLEGCRALAQSDGFKAWVNARALDHASRALKFRMEKGELTLENLQAITTTATQTRATEPPRWVNAGAVAMGMQKWSKAVPTSLTRLNAATGGGFRKGEAWLVAAAPGGGKTILANQWLWDFAEGGRNVVLVTTEQEPAALIPRVISNAANISFSTIQAARDRAMQSDQYESDGVPVIPEELRSDPNLNDRINKIITILGQRVLFVDWTKGNKRSIVGDLAPDIERIKSETGWIPDVILFDWLGGALAQAESKDRIRLVYKEAADAFVQYCRDANAVGIMFAQVNQAEAKNQQRVTMAMLAECKSCSDRMHGFMGVSSIRPPTDFEAGESSPRLQKTQWINVDKARTGPGGLVKVLQDFEYQKFGNFTVTSVSGE